MSSTPRAKPTAKPEGAAKEKKPKAKKPKAPTAPISLEMPMNKPGDLDEAGAKADLEQLQKKYGVLVVSFNNQQVELADAQKEIVMLNMQLERMEEGLVLSSDDQVVKLSKEVETLTAQLRAVEATNMSLQKKVNKLAIEHVSEEEVDQLFFCTRNEGEAAGGD